MKPSNDVVSAVQAQLSAGHFKRAVQMCDRELKLSPGNLLLLALMSAACEHDGQFDRARHAAQQWIELAPLDAHAHYRLAAIEQRLQNYASARQRFELAAWLAPPETDVAAAAVESLDILDHVQLQQVAALQEVDLGFRLKLQSSPEKVLIERGFALEAGLARRLAALATPTAPWAARPPRPC